MILCDNDLLKFGGHFFITMEFKPLIYSCNNSIVALIRLSKTSKRRILMADKGKSKGGSSKNTNKGKDKGKGKNIKKK